MLNLYFKKSYKNTMWSAVLIGVLLFPLISSLPSLTTQATLAKYAYAQPSRTGENSLTTPRCTDTNSVGIIKKNTTTQIFNQDNISDITTAVESTIKNPLVNSKKLSNNENNFFSNITNSTANISGTGNTATQGSSAESADFNGDGFDDLAVGVPNEDVEVGATCTANLAIGSVTASGNDGNVPQNVLDNNLDTRWSSLGIGQFITADLGSIKNICSVDIAWYKGNARQYHFVISTSTDGTTFTNALTRDSSGTTLNPEKYVIPFTNARYVKVTVNGNSVNNWASITELGIFRLSSPSETIFDTGAVNVIYGSSDGLNSVGFSAGNGRADQVWTQVGTGVEPGDRFGYALATGDFNRDGYSDLAIGVPGEDIDTTHADAGAVNVIYGSSGGLSANAKPIQIWTQAVSDGVEPGDRFGHALATGDFNRDGYSDLAIGVPSEDIGTDIANTGAVNVIYGSSSGLSDAAMSPDNGRDDQIWTQNSPGIRSNFNWAEPGDWFGSSFTTGDFNNDTFSDLAIGVSDKDIRSDTGSNITDAGLVIVIYGSSDGLSGTGLSENDGRWHQLWTQDSDDIQDHAEPGDRFGHALATGDFNRDGYSDLAIGVWEEEIGTRRYTGAVNVIYGTCFGLLRIGWGIPPLMGRDNQIWTQDGLIYSNSEEGDRFGSALATGDFNKDGYSDLAIGAPYEDLGILDAAGALNVIYGSSGGLSATGVSLGDGRINQIWMQNSTKIEGDPQVGDLLGSALAAGDFNRDGISDLAIGVPGEDFSVIQPAAGAVNVIYGSKGVPIGSGGLSATVPFGGFGRANQLWTQGSLDVEGDPEAEDRFGSSLG
jgi:hypothetical protein